MAEYGVVLAVITLGVIVALSTLGTNITSKITNAATDLAP
jgi:Flp pilus assembly pilin Flp